MARELDENKHGAYRLGMYWVQIPVSGKIPLSGSI